MTFTVCYMGAGRSDFHNVRSNALQPCERQDGTKLIVVVDAADETQAVSSMPLVRGSGNASLLRRRRLEREFPGVALKTALPHSHRPAEGLADIVLMSVDSAGTLAPELTQLNQTACVRGVYTPAMLAAHWMQLAGQQHRKALIVMPTPAGLRLMFMDRCCPLLSRLVQQAAPATVAVEIARTIQYLHNSQRLARDAQLELWFWGMDDASVSASLPAGDNYQLGAAPRVPGLPDPEEAGFDALLVLGATHPPRRQLAPHAWRTTWHARLVRRWALTAVAAATLACAICSGLLLADAARIRAAAGDVTDNESAYEEQRRQLEEQLARDGLSIDEFISFPVVADAVRSSEVGPEEALRLAAGLLGARRELLVQSLEFQSGTLGADSPATSGGCTTDVAPGVPVLEAAFRLADGLPVRAGSEALAHVRSATDAAGPWQSSPMSSALGERQPLEVRSSTEGTAGADTEWLTCLWRGATS